jgi:hypothetical protein
VEETAHNPLISGAALTNWPPEPSHDRGPETSSSFVIGRTLDINREQRSPTTKPEQARSLSLIRIIWITVYVLMMLAFDWEAGFQFNASPSTVYRKLAGVLSVIGFVFCLKMVWKELTSLKAGFGTGADG